MRDGIGRAVLRVQRRVKEKLSGEVLNVRTGRLRRSIVERVESSGSVVTGIVGTNVEYAAPHEYGFIGVVTVKESLRVSKLTFTCASGPGGTQGAAANSISQIMKPSLAAPAG